MSVNNFGLCKGSLIIDDYNTSTEPIIEVVEEKLEEIKKDDIISEIKEDAKEELEDVEYAKFEKRIELYRPETELGKLLEMAKDRSNPMDKLVMAGHSRYVYVHNIGNRDVWINEVDLPPMLAYRHDKLIELMCKEWNYENRKGVYILEYNIQTLVKGGLSKSKNVITTDIDIKPVNPDKLERIFKGIPRIDSVIPPKMEEREDAELLLNKISYGVDKDLYKKIEDNFDNIYPVMLDGRDSLEQGIRYKYELRNKKYRFIKVIFIPMEELNKQNSIIAKQISISLDVPENVNDIHKDINIDNIRYEIFDTCVKTYYLVSGKKIIPIKSIIGDKRELLIHTSIGSKSITPEDYNKYGIFDNKLDARKLLMDRDNVTQKQIEVLSLITKLSSIEADLKMSNDRLDISKMKVTIERYKLEVAQISTELEKLKLERGHSEVFSKTLDNSSKLINSIVSIIDTMLYVIDKIN